MTRKEKRIPKWVIASLIPIIIVVLVSIALFITNAFIPVKYLTAYFVKGQKNADGEMRVTYLDVGFGDSALVELPDGKVMLIDGGNGEYSNELSLIKYLNSRKVNRIDFLICSSVKDEHCGGLAEFVKYKEVGTAYIPYCANPDINEEYRAFTDALKSKNVTCVYAGVGAGYADETAGYFFTFLSPTDKDSPMSQYVDMNTTTTEENIEKASIVTWVQYGKSAFAFTSDARTQTLKNIVEGYEFSKLLNQPYCKIGTFSVELEDCKVVTVPAHGGENNTYAPWYDLLKPEHAVLSVGKNFAGYPSTKSLFEARTYAQLLDVREKGNIVITASAESVTVL